MIAVDGVCPLRRSIRPWTSHGVRKWSFQPRAIGITICRFHLMPASIVSILDSC